MVVFLFKVLDTAEKALRDLAREASDNRRHQHATSQPSDAEDSKSEKENIAQVFQQAIKSIPLSG
jgi:hypothetical protein